MDLFRIPQKLNQLPNQLYDERQLLSSPRRNRKLLSSAVPMSKQYHDKPPHRRQSLLTADG